MGKFEWVAISDEINLSIQASFAHYCSPRKTLTKENYQSMELAIIKNNEFVTVSEVTSNLELINKFDQYYEGTVYGFVPIELLEELYQDLARRYSGKQEV